MVLLFLDTRYGLESRGQVLLGFNDPVAEGRDVWEHAKVWRLAAHGLDELVGIWSVVVLRRRSLTVEVLYLLPFWVGVAERLPVFDVSHTVDSFSGLVAVQRWKGSKQEASSHLSFRSTVDSVTPPSESSDTDLTPAHCEAGNSVTYL